MVVWQEDGSHDDVPMTDLGMALVTGNDLAFNQQLVRIREGIKRDTEDRDATEQERAMLKAIGSILARERKTVENEPKLTDGKSLPSEGGLK